MSEYLATQQSLRIARDAAGVLYQHLDALRSELNQQEWETVRQFLSDCEVTR